MKIRLSFTAFMGLVVVSFQPLKGGAVNAKDCTDTIYENNPINKYFTNHLEKEDRNMSQYGPRSQYYNKMHVIHTIIYNDCKDGDALFAMGQAARKGVKRLIRCPGGPPDTISKADIDEAKIYYKMAAELKHQRAIDVLEKLNRTSPKKGSWFSFE